MNHACEPGFSGNRRWRGPLQGLDYGILELRVDSGFRPDSIDAASLETRTVGVLVDRVVFVPEPPLHARPQ